MDQVVLDGIDNISNYSNAAAVACIHAAVT
jgi:hypothetical protein